MRAFTTIHYISRRPRRTRCTCQTRVPAIHVASLCVHNNFCSCSVARTLMFNAKKDQLEAYRCICVCAVCVLCVWVRCVCGCVCS